MTRQGRCGDPIPDEMSIPDRLEGLTKVIPSEVIEQALFDSGRGKQKACRLSHREMLWVVLSMGMLAHMPIRQVFQHAHRMLPGQRTPSRGNLCEGRRRLGAEPVRRVFDQVVCPLATPETPGAFYKNLRLMAMDGTVMDAPDTPANDARFGRSSGGRGKGAFPQVRKVSLVELGTHVEVALAFGGWQDAEQTLAERLYPKIPPDSLLLEDRGFFSYTHWKELDGRGVKLLLRLKKNHVLTAIRTLADGSRLVKIYPSAQDRAKDQDGMVVRLIEYTVDDPQRVGHGEIHRLLTNLIDHDQYPAQELICLYHERWEEELVYDEQKTHLGPRCPGKAAHFRGATPEGVEQELYALSLAHFAVRALMLKAAKLENLDVDRLSFTGCLHILRTRLPECASSDRVRLEQWYRQLLEEMSQERIPPRRNRINPRVVKRKMSKFAKKRPEHRDRPSLKKRFAETVVIT